MSVILFIFKLIGIILLAGLGFLLIVSVLLLLVPVQYHVAGRLEEECIVQVKLTWLMHLISFVVNYQNEEQNVCLRILGIRKKAKQKDVSDEDKWENTEDIHDDEKAGEAWEVRETERAPLNEPDARQESVKAEGRAVNRTFFTRIRTRIQAFFETVRRIRRVLPQLYEKISDIRGIFTDESNRIVATSFWMELGYLLRHFQFRRLFTDLQFSMGDPAATGQVLGALCMFPILYRYQISIVPNFESDEFYVKGTFEIKGHMRAVHMLVTLVHLYQKREVRIFIKKLLNGKDGQQNGRQ